MGRQRRVEPVLRQRLCLLRRLPRQRQRLHQPAARRAHVARRRRELDPAPGHAGHQQHQEPQRLRALGLHRAHRLARRRLRLRLPVRLQPDDGGRRTDPDDPVPRRRRALAAPGEHLHRLRHLQRLRALDRALRRGRRRRRAQRPLARLRRSTSPTARRPAPMHRTGSCSAGSTVATASTTSTSCSAPRPTAAAHWTTPRAGRARRRPRLLLGAGDLAERHRRLARLQRVRRAVQGQRDRRRQRPAVDRPGPARDGRLRTRVGAFAPVAPRGVRRRARLVAEQPRRRVPRRLRLRRGHADLLA